MNLRRGVARSPATRDPTSIMVGVRRRARSARINAPSSDLRRPLTPGSAILSAMRLRTERCRHARRPHSSSLTGCAAPAGSVPSAAGRAPTESISRSTRSVQVLPRSRSDSRPASSHHPEAPPRVAASGGSGASRLDGGGRRAPRQASVPGDALCSSAGVPAVRWRSYAKALSAMFGFVCSCRTIAVLPISHRTVASRVGTSAPSRPTPRPGSAASTATDAPRVRGYLAPSLDAPSPGSRATAFIDVRFTGDRSRPESCGRGRTQ